MINIISLTNTSFRPTPTSAPIPDRVFVTMNFANLLTVNDAGDPLFFEFSIMGPAGEIGRAQFPITGTGESTLDPSADAGGNVVYEVPLNPAGQGIQGFCGDQIDATVSAFTKDGRVFGRATGTLICNGCPDVTVTNVSWSDPCINNTRDVTIDFDVTASDITQTHVVEVEVAGVSTSSLVLTATDFSASRTVSRQVTVTLAAGASYGGVVKVLVPLGCAPAVIDNFTLPACTGGTCPVITLDPPTIGPCQTRAGVSYREVTLSGTATGNIALGYWTYGHNSNVLDTQSANIGQDANGAFTVTAEYPAPVGQAQSYIAEFHIIDSTSPAQCTRFETVEVLIAPCEATCPTNLAQGNFTLEEGSCITTGSTQSRQVAFVPNFAFSDRVFTASIDWGDGSPVENFGSSATSYGHNYVSFGSFTVTLTLTYNNGCTETRDVPLTVTPCGGQTPAPDDTPTDPADPDPGPGTGTPGTPIPDQPAGGGLGVGCWILLILSLALLLLGQLVFVLSVCFATSFGLPILFIAVVPFTILTLVGFIGMILGALLLLLWLFLCARLDCRVYEGVRIFLRWVAIIEVVLTIVTSLVGPICIISAAVATLTTALVYVIFEAVGDFFECNIRTQADPINTARRGLRGARSNPPKKR